MPRRDAVRILLVGDASVGKSTLVTSLIKESFVPHVQHVVPEVTIPSEVTPEGVTTTIVDSSSAPGDGSSSSGGARNHLLRELARAHVICLVYSVADGGQSWERVAEHWLPLFRREGVNVPVILVGNKIDLRGPNPANSSLEDEVAPLMRDFKEVETAVECSAKLPLNVSEVFYFAQKAVLHPTAPLYDSREHILKPKCTEALRRIFKVSDVDKDGLLNSAELNQFQQKCFATPLQLQELEGILDLVRAYDPSCVRPVVQHHPSTSQSAAALGEGITELGFLYLHTIFVQQGRMETTWAVLRKFGYGEGLDLTEDVLSPRFDVPSDCSVELSPLGNQFFTDIFEAYDRDQDGALCENELEELFSTSPGNPWREQGFPATTITDDEGKVTLQGWLAQWSLGYNCSPSSLDLATTTALKVTRSRKAERRARKVTRNVFLCYVLGAAGSGKTSLLKSFVQGGRRDRREEAYEPTSKVVSVVNSVEVGGGEKYLVVSTQLEYEVSEADGDGQLQEFGSKYESETLRNPRRLEAADVIIYVFDSSDPNSFSYVSNLRQQYALDDVPSIFVATKSDLDLAQQRHEVQPDVYARRLGLPVPLSVSSKLGPLPNLWTTVTRIGLDPMSSIPRDPSRPRGGLLPRFANARAAALGWTLGATLGLGVVGAALWAIGRYYGLSTAGIWGFGGGGAASGGTGTGWWAPWRWFNGSSGGARTIAGGGGAAARPPGATGTGVTGAVGLSGSSRSEGGGGAGGGSWWSKMFGGGGGGGAAGGTTEL